MKRLSLLTQRKLQNSPGSIYKYSFITCRREVIGIRRKMTETLAYLFTICNSIQRFKAYCLKFFKFLSYGTTDKIN